MAVRENRLVSVVLTEADYVHAIEVGGACWVVEAGGRIVGFAAGSVEDGNVWALFVHPDYEGRGYGRQLHDRMVASLRDQGVERLWLTTEPGTRAETFYLAAGWRRTGTTHSGEARFELAL
jgi:GNAT superfamily N-acetyltransferase